MADSTIKIDTKALDDLIRIVGKAPDIKARIGILGKTNSRSDGSSNAQIGAAHEFGSPTRNLPQRSFIRVPLSTKLNNKIEHSQIYQELLIDKSIKEKSLVPLMEAVAVMGEAIVKESFLEQGPGWDATKKHTGTGMILDDTGQLKNSITSEVKGK